MDMGMVGRRVKGKRGGKFSEFVGSLLVEVGISNELWMMDICIKYVGVLYLWSRSTSMGCVWFMTPRV